MDDLEIVKRCAEKMDWPAHVTENGTVRILPLDGRWVTYDPLHDDAQAMALVKKFELKIAPLIDGVDHAGWVCGPVEETEWLHSASAGVNDLNRAICLCVASLP